MVRRQAAQPVAPALPDVIRLDVGQQSLLRQRGLGLLQPAQHRLTDIIAKILARVMPEPWPQRYRSEFVEQQAAKMP